MVGPDGRLLALYQKGRAAARPLVVLAGAGLMHVVRNLDACPDLPGSVVTIGAFDGIHLGHQALLRLVREKAAERGLLTRS